MNVSFNILEILPFRRPCWRTWTNPNNDNGIHFLSTCPLHGHKSRGFLEYIFLYLYIYIFEHSRLGIKNSTNQKIQSLEIGKIWLVWFGRLGLVNSVWYVWFGKFNFVGLAWQVWFGLVFKFGFAFFVIFIVVYLAYFACFEYFAYFACFEYFAYFAYFQNMHPNQQGQVNQVPTRS